jgi:hypothetical protein
MVTTYVHVYIYIYINWTAGYCRMGLQTGLFAIVEWVTTSSCTDILDPCTTTLRQLFK